MIRGSSLHLYCIGDRSVLLDTQMWLLASPRCPKIDQRTDLRPGGRDCGRSIECA